MKVYFEDSYGKERLLGLADNEREYILIIDEFLKAHKYKLYYIRSWKPDENTLKIDVGSHTEFFLVRKE